MSGSSGTARKRSSGAGAGSSFPRQPRRRPTRPKPKEASTRRPLSTAALGAAPLPSAALPSRGETVLVVPAAVHAGDAGIVQVPHAIRLAAGRWRLSYVADGYGAGSAGPQHNTGTAISTDAGLTWTVENPAATGVDSVDPDVVRLDDGTHRLCDKHHESLRTAGCADGESYPGSRASGLAVLDAADRHDPAVIRLPDGTTRMSFGTKGGVGSAVAAGTAR